MAGLRHPKRTALVVDDEEPFLLSLADGVAAFDSEIRVVTASSGQAALELVDRLAVDLLVTDLRMPGMDGLELIRSLRARRPCLPVIVMTAFKSPTAEAELARFSPLAILDKPLDLGELFRAIRTALLPEDGNHLFLVTPFLAALILFTAGSLEAASLPGERCTPRNPAELESRQDAPKWRFASCSDPRV